MNELLPPPELSSATHQEERADADLRTDVPKYCVWRDGEVVEDEAKLNREKFDRLFRRLCREEIDSGSTIQTSTGREVTIPMSGKYTKVARFSFDDLCAKPLGAADFVQIAATFHTIFLEDIPILTLNDINEDCQIDKHR